MHKTSLQLLGALLAAAMIALAWIGYRRPDMAFALFGWLSMCM